MTEPEEIILKTPEVPDGETLKFSIKKKEDRKTIGNRTYSVNRIFEDEKECYKVHVKTESNNEELREIIEETSVIEITEILKPISRHMITTVKDGKLISDSKMNYEEFDKPINCCASLSTVGLYLRGSPITPKSNIHINVMMMERFFKINATIVKEKEIISVPAGTFECHKVELVPDIASLMEQLPTGFNFPQAFYSLAQRLASRFMPSVFYWYSTEGPYHPIKYEGVEPMSSSVGEPIIEELLGIE